MGLLATAPTTGLLAQGGSPATTDEPRQWRKLDRTGRRAMQQAEARLARTTPMGIPVGQTPSGAYVGVYWQYGTCHPIAAMQLECLALDGTSGTAEAGGAGGCAGDGGGAAEDGMVPVVFTDCFASAF